MDADDSNISFVMDESNLLANYSLASQGFHLLLFKHAYYKYKLYCMISHMLT